MGNAPTVETPATAMGNAPTVETPATAMGNAPTVETPATAMGNAPTVETPATAMGNAPTVETPATALGNAPTAEMPAQGGGSGGGSTGPSNPVMEMHAVPEGVQAGDPQPPGWQAGPVGSVEPPASAGPASGGPATEQGMNTIPGGHDAPSSISPPTEQGMNTIPGGTEAPTVLDGAPVSTTEGAPVTSTEGAPPSSAEPATVVDGAPVSTTEGAPASSAEPATIPDGAPVSESGGGPTTETGMPAMPEGGGSFEDPIRGAVLDPERMASAGDPGSGQGESHGAHRAEIPGIGEAVVKVYPDTPEFRAKAQGEIAVGQIAAEAGIGVPMHGAVEVPPTSEGNPRIGVAMGEAEGGFPDASRNTPEAIAEAHQNARNINDQSFQDVNTFRDALTDRGYVALGDIQGFVGPDGRWRPIDFQSYEPRPDLTPGEIADINNREFSRYSRWLEGQRAAAPPVQRLAEGSRPAPAPVQRIAGQRQAGPAPAPAAPEPEPLPEPVLLRPVARPRPAPVTVQAPQPAPRPMRPAVLQPVALQRRPQPQPPQPARTIEQELPPVRPPAAAGPASQFGNNVGGVMAGGLQGGVQGAAAGARQGAELGERVLPGGVGAGVGVVAGAGMGAVQGAMRGVNQALSQRPGVTIDPRTGAGAELVNPRYKNPPGTPGQIAALRADIARLDAEHAATQRTRATALQQAGQGQALRAAADQARTVTQQGSQKASATTQEASTREGANQQAQGQQGDAHSKVASYPERAAGLAVLNTPLRAFRGFLHFAQMLPGDVGAKFHQMDQEAGRFQASLAQVSAQMAQTAAQGPAALAGWQAEQQQLVGARAQAQGAGQTFDQQTQHAEQIGQKADQNVAVRQAAAQKAASHGTHVQSQIQARENRANTLAGQLSAWAAEHKGARLQAIEETKARYEARGYRVTVRGQ
jgi:hypothetical protein